MTASTTDRPASWSELKPNKDVFVATLAHIEAFPEHHDQGPWRCGTSMCFGGWATQVAGFNWKVKSPRSAEVVVPLSAVPETDLSGRSTRPSIAVTSGEELAVLDCSSAAMIALGIDEERAFIDEDWLFDADRTLPQLYNLSAKILGISVRTLKRRVEKYRDDNNLRDFVKKPKMLSKPLRWRRRA